MATFFLSHSSHDRELTERVRDRLRAEGFESLFLDFDPEFGIPAGRVWEDELYVQLRAADAGILLATPAFAASSWCLSELTMMRAERKPFFALVFDRSAVR